MRTILAVTRKELRQISRDPRTLLIMAFMPAFFLVVFGYALNFDIRHIALAVDDSDNTAESRELVSAFVHSGYFDLKAAVHSPAEAESLIDANRARAVLVIPEGFSRTVTTGGTSPVQVIVNGDNATTATTIIGHATSILQAASERLAAGSIAVSAATGSSRAPVRVEPRIWYNPELRSALFLVPGLIAYISMIMAVTSTALSVVREKESGTIEQIRMAPVRTFAFIIGKTVPYFFVALGSAAIVFVASMVLFDLPMRGNWLTLLVTLSLYLVGALATGIFVSTISDTQQVAFQIALLLSMLPTLMLSGFIFPIASMPAVLQAITHIVPARYFLLALRGIVLKGSSASHVLPELGALTLYATAMLSVAALRLWRERA